MANNKFNLTAELVLRAKNLPQIQKQIRQAVQQSSTKDARGATAATAASQKLARQNAETAASQHRLTQAAKQTNMTMNQYAKSASNARRESSTFVRDIASLTAGVVSLHKGLILVQQGFRDFVAYESEVTAMSQVLGNQRDIAKELGRRASELGQKYGVASQSLQGTFRELLQAGKSVKQVEALSETLAKLGLNAQVGAEGLQSVAKGVIAWQNVFGTSDSAIVNTLEKSVALSKTQFISVKELIESSTILNKVWSEAGGTLDQMLSTLAAVKTASGRPGSEVSRGLSTLVQRITAPETKNFLRGQGIKLFDDDTGNFRGIIAVLTDLTELQKRLGSTTEAGKELGRILAGVRRQAIGQTLLSELDQIRANMQTVGKAAGSLDNDVQDALGDIATKTTQLKETWKASFREMMEGTGGQITGAILDTVKGLARMESSLYGIAAALAVVATRAGAVKLGGMGSMLASAGRFAGARGIGAQLHRKVGMGGGYALASGAAFIGAANIQGKDAGSAIARGGLEGTGVGLGALAAGVNPLVAGFAAATTAAVSLADGLHEAKQAALFAGTEDIGEKTASNIKRKGALDVDTLASFRRDVNLLVQKEKETSISQPGLGKTALAEIGATFGIGGGEAELVNKTLAANRKQLQSKAKELEQQMDIIVDAFIKGGGSAKEVKKILPQIQQLDNLIDDGILNSSSNILKTIKEQIEKKTPQAKRETQEQLDNIQAGILGSLPDRILAGKGKALLGDISTARDTVGNTLKTGTFNENNFREVILSDLRKAGISKAVGQSIEDSLEDLNFDQFSQALREPSSLLNLLTQGLSASTRAAEEYARKQIEATQKLNQEFSNLLNLRNQVQSARGGAEGIRFNLASFVASQNAGQNLDPMASRTLLRNQVGSTIPEQMARLRQADAAYERTGDERFALIADDARAKLQQLANVTARTATAMEALNRAQSSKQGKLGLAEQYIMASPQERARMQYQKGAAEHVAKTGSLEGLNDQQRKAAISGLNMMGNITYRGGGQFQGMTGNEIKNQILGGAGIVDTSPEDARIETLHKQIKDEHLIAAKAMQEVAKSLQGILGGEVKDADTKNRNLFEKLGNFGNEMQLASERLSNIGQQLSAIPSNIEHYGTFKHEVIINGAQTLANLEPAIKEAAIAAIREKLNPMIDNMNDGNPPQNV